MQNPFTSENICQTMIGKINITKAQDKERKTLVESFIIVKALFDMQLIIFVSRFNLIL